MMPLDFFQQVAKFHRTFKHPIADKPTIPDKKRCALRVALIEEELEELKTALAEKDMVKTADALCDIQYVLCGAVLEFGLQDKFNDLFAEVQRSNMSKTCSSEEEARLTVQHYADNLNTACYFVKSENKWLVYRKKDNKTIKSINYSQARIAELLTKPKP